MRQSVLKTAVVMAAVILAIFATTAAAENLIRNYPTDDSDHGAFDIDLWIDHEDGIYYEGESISIYFQASHDCYVAIYSIDTRGELNLLYPTERWHDGQIRAGEVYTLPHPSADFNLVVNGPEGIEHIQAVASRDRMDIPDWSYRSPEYYNANDDVDDFIDYVNQRYFGCRWDPCERVYSRASIYVKEPQNYYKPVYVPTNWWDYPDYTTVYVDYPFGGEVYINGIFIGYAPLYIPRIYWGWHWVTIYDRYGYCWENRVHINNHNYYHITRTQVKTSRTTESRYKEIRQQAQKYDRSSLKRSEYKVKSTRSDYRSARTKTYEGYSTSRDKSRSTYNPDSRERTKSSGIYRGSDSRKSTTSRSSGITRDKSSSRKSTEGTSRKSTTIRRDTGSKSTDRSSGSSVKRGSGSSSSGSSGSSVKRGSGSSSSGSSGSSVKRGGGSSSSKSSGSSRKSGGSSGGKRR